MWPHVEPGLVTASVTEVITFVLLLAIDKYRLGNPTLAVETSSTGSLLLHIWKVDM